jgi:hypothetical protein
MWLAISTCVSLVGDLNRYSVCVEVVMFFVVEGVGCILLPIEIMLNSLNYVRFNLLYLSE